MAKVKFYAVTEEGLYLKEENKTVSLKEARDRCFVAISCDDLAVFDQTYIGQCKQ